MSIDQKTEQHIDETLAKLRAIYVEAATRIDALKGEEKVPATKLAEEIASSRGMTGPQLYPTLKFLFDGYPGVKISRGAHGGIQKVQPQVEEVKATP
jgi:hypothetical protein